MAISLCVLCAFAVRLRNPGQLPGPPKEGFSPRRKARKGQARSGLGLTNCMEIPLLELPKYASLDDNDVIVHRIRFRRTRTQRSGTQCNGTRTRWLFELRHYRSLIEAVRGNLRIQWPHCYPRSLRVRVPSAAAD
jgi:hypothetical protein